MDQDSRILLERASQGDPSAVDALLQRHLPGLQDFVRRNLGQLVQRKESSSDLVQSACREVLEHAGRFQYDGEEGFRRWLYTTALRKIQNRHRYYKAEKRDARREAPAAAVPSSTGAMDWVGRLAAQLTSASGVAMRQEHLERLSAALERLPERAREVVTLAYFEQLSRDEIAERLGITAANARMILARALARLARTLQELGPDEG